MECKKCNQVVCHKCCTKKEYAPGYKDVKVEVCTWCYEEVQRIKQAKSDNRKSSVFKSDFVFQSLIRDLEMNMR